MNNEPVAWLRYENEHWRLDFPMVRFYTNVETPEIPLYTTPELARKLHPTKTLTDEEIAVIWANHSVPMTGMEFKKVVEAILKKANNG